jgi:hypothetical protein
MTTLDITSPVDETRQKLVQLRFKNKAEEQVIHSVTPRLRTLLLVKAILEADQGELSEQSIEQSIKTGPKVDTGHDKYVRLNEKINRWEIIGTHKKNGEPVSYANNARGLNSARILARRAYPDGKPRFQKGERLWYSPDGKTRQSVILAQPMSYLCSIGYTDDGSIIQARRILGPVYQEKEGEK